MDLITRQMLSQRKVDRINKNVWETVKRIGSLLEVEDHDSDNDFFYAPPSNPLEPTFVKLQNC
jgi:hypothetical protein